MPRVYIPTVMRKYVDGRPSFDVSGQTVDEVLAGAYRAFPTLAAEVLDKEGKIKPYIAVFINSTSLHDMEKNARMRDDDEVHFVPAIAGG
ncbi:MAG: MoaD/ThiS family protein [Candidatus Sulfotelmatobacter sp.]